MVSEYFKNSIQLLANEFKGYMLMVSEYFKNSIQLLANEFKGYITT